ncbi:MAG TPA: hypothetical protein VFY51_08600, partial [Pyrinomonadaceae bacterium]|nr:hypothetical protein [Pyrinomonadaceae bacterium]
MQSSVAWNRFPLAIAPAPSLTWRSTLFGMMSTSMATIIAVLLVPENPTAPGALFYPALVLSVGLASAPFAAALRQPKAILRGESLLALAPIYWLLLDLLQGVYSLDYITADEVRLAFTGIGLFVGMVWVGAIRRPWRIPTPLIRSVSQEFSLNTYFALAVACFVIGMLNFAIACNFNVVEMVHYLGQERWAAPWGRGQLGGWDAFLDHLQYFGYLLPILTVVISRRSGLRSPRTLICVAMSIVMTLFLAQSGSRRVIGVVAGMALVLWVLDQRQIRIKHLFTTVLAIVALLVALQIMLEYRNVGLGALVGNTDTS